MALPSGGETEISTICAAVPPIVASRPIRTRRPTYIVPPPKSRKFRIAATHGFFFISLPRDVRLADSLTGVDRSVNHEMPTNTTRERLLASGLELIHAHSYGAVSVD